MIAIADLTCSKTFPASVSAIFFASGGFDGIVFIENTASRLRFLFYYNKIERLSQSS